MTCHIYFPVRFDLVYPSDTVDLVSSQYTFIWWMNWTSVKGWHNTSTLEVQCHFTTWSRNSIQRPQTFFSCLGWWLKESSRGSRGIPRLHFGLWEQHCQRSLSASQLLQECALITYTDLQTMKSDATFTIYCLLWCTIMLNQLRLPCATQDWIPGYWMVAIYIYYMIQRKFHLGRL